MVRRSGPLILGLTGSIAMGKSETVGMFRRLRVPVFDSDAEVHRLLGQDGPAVGPVSAAFPGVMRAGAIDRQALGEHVFENDSKLCILEEIVHPLVSHARRRFLRIAGVARASVVLVDVPLLFETGGDVNCDAVVVVSAPGFVQRQRAMARPSMSSDKLKAILARQMPDSVKRQRADFVIPTGIGKRTALLAICKILKIITGDALCRHRSWSRRRVLARSCS